MATNDYWAYLRDENSLKHSRPFGSRNGYTTDSNYKPVGKPAEGVRQSDGRYLYGDRVAEVNAQRSQYQYQQAQNRAAAKAKLSKLESDRMLDTGSRGIDPNILRAKGAMQAKKANRYGEEAQREGDTQYLKTYASTSPHMSDDEVHVLQDRVKALATAWRFGNKTALLKEKIKKKLKSSMSKLGSAAKTGKEAISTYFKQVFKRG
jgi:hypothetical protein